MTARLADVINGSQGSVMNHDASTGDFQCGVPAVFAFSVLGELTHGRKATGYGTVQSEENRPSLMFLI
jgi:hypothetical protein